MMLPTPINRVHHMSIKALDHINLTIEQGKYYAIVGQTGSGKSTLIDISMGY